MTKYVKPPKWEGWLKFWLVVLVGSGTFILFYFLLVDGKSIQTDFMRHLGYVIVLIILSSLMALIVAIFVGRLILHVVHRPSRGLYALVKIPDETQFRYEIFAMTFNAIAVVFGLLTFLRSLTDSVWLFMGYFIGAKLFTRGLAYIVANAMRNSVLIMVFYAGFAMLAMYSFIEMVGL